MSLNHVIGVQAPNTPFKAYTIEGTFPIALRSFLPLGTDSRGQIISITGTAGITGTMGITGGQNIGITGANSGITVFNTPNASFNGITLSQTASLSPSQLTYYNETTYNIPYVGIWAVGLNVSTKITKVGKLVTATSQQLSATANKSDVVVGALQSSDHYPINTFSTPIVVQNNGTFAFGRLEINASGAIQISIDASSGAFTGSGASGFLGWSASWEAA